MCIFLFFEGIYTFIISIILLLIVKSTVIVVHISYCSISIFILIYAPHMAYARLLHISLSSGYVLSCHIGHIIMLLFDTHDA